MKDKIKILVCVLALVFGLLWIFYFSQVSYHSTTFAGPEFHSRSADDSKAVYSAGYFANVSGATRTSYAAHDRTTGALLPWNLETLQPSLNDSRVLATETAVYATGFFKHLDPVWGPTLIEVSNDAGTPST